MSLINAPKFVCGEDALLQFRRTLGTVACPHCAVTGGLIGHGCLRGYIDTGAARAVRGHRFLCSRRACRAGCGLTFSVIFSYLLKGSMVGLRALVPFVRAVVSGSTRRSAWRQVAAKLMSLQTAYRICKRLTLAQIQIRARLCRLCPPPGSSSSLPLAQLIDHLHDAFPCTDTPRCPFEAFQLHFQASLLA